MMAGRKARVYEAARSSSVVREQSKLSARDGRVKRWVKIQNKRVREKKETYKRMSSLWKKGILKC